VSVSTIAFCTALVREPNRFGTSGIALVHRAVSTVES
jgi:hypothetical protein